jgi:hypothetical protein
MPALTGFRSRLTGRKIRKGGRPSGPSLPSEAGGKTGVWIITKIVFGAVQKRQFLISHKTLMVID